MVIKTKKLMKNKIKTDPKNINIFWKKFRKPNNDFYDKIKI
jgi:hypothetical protein